MIMHLAQNKASAGETGDFPQENVLACGKVIAGLMESVDNCLQDVGGYSFTYAPHSLR